MRLPSSGTRIEHRAETHKPRNPRDHQVLDSRQNYFFADCGSGWSRPAGQPVLARVDAVSHTHPL